MKSKIYIFAICIAFSFQLSAQKTVLFNGKNLNKWYAFEPTSGKHENANELFKIEKHLIRLYGNKSGYLMTKQSFSNFKLTAQYRWNIDSTFTKTSKAKNSGVMYLVPDTAIDKLWCTGIQFQIKQNCSGDFVFLGGVTTEIDGKKTTAGKSVNYSKMTNAEKEYGKWNKIEIIFQNETIIQKLNGRIVNKAKNPSVNSGKISLQYEGYPIDFRNIKIVKL